MSVPIPLPKGVVLPPLVAYAVAGITSAVGLFVSQGLVSNGGEKLVVGLASILIPLGYLAVNAVAHHSAAKVEIARINAGPPGGVG